MYKLQTLRDIEKTKDFFIGIDSDGCVFDSMELKYKECFCPNLIKYWGLQNVSKIAREVWEFVTLYSHYRGSNRFFALLKTIELLGKREEVKSRGTIMPDMTELKLWYNSELKSSNLALEKYIINNPGNKTLERAFEWSSAVSRDIADMVHELPPFNYVRESLQQINKNADSMVISQTPMAALNREWNEHNILQYVSCIVGQEYGTKTEHFQYAAKGKYKDDRILMIGDAPGDLKAAKNNNALFYPIIAEKEELSWQRFLREALNKFFDGTYNGEYENSLINEFLISLPDNPKWNLVE